MTVDWENGATSLFWFSSQDDAPDWLTDVEIVRIRWKNEAEAILLLRGLLPSSSHFLSNFSDGDELRVHYIKWGERWDPSNGDLIMIFRSCEVQRKWIENPVVFDPASRSRIKFYMRLKCRFELP